MVQRILYRALRELGSASSSVSSPGGASSDTILHVVRSVSVRFRIACDPLERVASFCAPRGRDAFHVVSGTVRYIWIGLVERSEIIADPVLILRLDTISRVLLAGVLQLLTMVANAADCGSVHRFDKGMIARIQKIPLCH